jgi:hypothetical protein
MIESRYVFDNAAEEQTRERFATLPRLYDPGTIRHLEALGVGAGWRCLEVGAGGGSVARWLAERVGPIGRVLATDIYVGSEHLLLGLAALEDGVAAQALAALGTSSKQIEEALLRVLASPAPQSAARSNVVACRVDDAALAAVEALVEAGVRQTRSDAAAWLIQAGIEANADLFERVHRTAREIQRLREEVHAVARELAARGPQAPGSSPAQGPQRSSDGTPRGAGARHAARTSTSRPTAAVRSDRGAARSVGGSPLSVLDASDN